jgi:hypothetical protein
VRALFACFPTITFFSSSSSFGGARPVASAAAGGDSEPTGQRTGDGAAGVRSREIELME